MLAGTKVGASLFQLSLGAVPRPRQKERQLKEMEPGGAEHVPRPFVNKRKFSFRFPPAPRCSQEVRRALVDVQPTSDRHPSTTPPHTLSPPLTTPSHHPFRSPPPR